MKKYEFTGETKVWDGITLHRIRALISFGSVTKGEIGGWIQKEENLPQDAYGDAWVCDDARVYGNARVCGNARVYGKAWVYGNARVYDDALVYGDVRVCGNARVYGNARVCDDAWVYDDALVCDDAWVYGNARVYDNARVYGKAWVYDDARVYGNAQVCGNARVYGDGRVYGNARVYGDARVNFTAVIATRSDGYTFACLPQEGKPTVITAGCRFFTFSEARAHWGATRKGTPLGDETFAILDYFEQMAKIHGWPVAC